MFFQLCNTIFNLKKFSGPLSGGFRAHKVLLRRFTLFYLDFDSCAVTRVIHAIKWRLSQLPTVYI